MAFGGFGTFFSRGKQGSGVAAKAGGSSISAGEAAAWMEERFSTAMREERARFSSMASGLIGSLKELERSVKRIHGGSFESGDRTYAAVNMIKETWAKKALMGFASYWKEVDERTLSAAAMDFPAFSALLKSTSRLMSDVWMIPRQKMVLDRYFEKESRGMAEMLKAAAASMGEMRTAADAPGKLKQADQLRSMAAAIEGLSAEEKALGGRLAALDRDIALKQKGMDGIRSSLDSIQMRKEWAEMKAADDSIREAEGKREALEREIDERLGGMKRVFKMFAHDSARLGGGERQLAESLAHSPLKAFMSAGPEKVEGLLGKLAAELESGGFRLSGKDAGKAGRARELLSSGWASAAWKGHELAVAEADALRKRREEFKISLEKGEAERSLEKAQLELGLMLKEKESLGSRLSAGRGRTREMKRQMEDLIAGSLGEKVEIL